MSLSENVITVTNESFETEVVQSNIPVLVDFFASWCGPCRMFAPTFEKMADKYVGVVKLAKVSMEDSPEIGEKYGVRSIPTLLLFIDGEIAANKVGALTESQLKAFIEGHINN
jgi:thioredoxin 1